MKRLRYSIYVLIISITALYAQNSADAEKVINDALAQIRTSAVTTNFTLKVSQKNAVNSHSSSGTFTMKGNKFVLDMDQMKAWFDGKTQWAYLAESNEVSITEPTEAELAETNPMAILSGYKVKSVIRFSKTKSAQNYVIDLLPKDKKSDFVSVEVQISKSGNNLASIRILDKKGQTIFLSLSNYKKGLTVADANFVFNKSKFKNVTVNDLR